MGQRKLRCKRSVTRAEDRLSSFSGQGEETPPTVLFYLSLKSKIKLLVSWASFSTQGAVTGAGGARLFLRGPLWFSRDFEALGTC